MLINTVILFMHYALPIFVLLGFLFVQVKLSLHLQFSAVLIGLIVALGFISQVDRVGAWLDGAGLEWFFFSLHLCLYSGVLLLANALLNRSIKGKNLAPVRLAVLLVIIMIVTKGSNFLLYFNGYLNQVNALQSLLVGTFVGLGICLSIAILLYFSMEWLGRHFGRIAPLTALLVFVAGQLANASNLLVQVDVLPATSVLWNSQWWLDDASEYGHLCNVLFGYVARPTALHMSVFIISILCPLVIQVWRLRHVKPLQRGVQQ
jgi:high-affinity iron transporter